MGAEGSIVVMPRWRWNEHTDRDLRDGLVVALRTQAERLVNGEFVTGLERINLLYEAADFIETGGSSSSLTPGAGDATQGAKDAEPGTASDSPPPEGGVRWCVYYRRDAKSPWLDWVPRLDEVTARLDLLYVRQEYAHYEIELRKITTTVERIND